MAPPSITNPFSIRGSTTRINGGAKGKLSGNIRCNKICSIFISFISSANGESGSTECNRAYHSYRLSLTSSTYKCYKEKSVTHIFIQFSFLLTYSENRVRSSSLNLLYFFVFFH